MKHTSDLHLEYKPYQPAERIKKIFQQCAPEDILVTSSFGTSSGILLKLISDIAPEHPVYFLDTQYHFDATLAYKKTLTARYGLNVKDIIPDRAEHEATRKTHMWENNPDHCCFVNKVKPMESLKRNHKIWISGIMAFQNANRANKKIFEWQDGICKFYPMLDYTAAEAQLFMEVFQVPKHPLSRQGYDSVGCTHCTRQGSQRSGRWANSIKAECGLHV